MDNHNNHFICTVCKRATEKDEDIDYIDLPCKIATLSICTEAIKFCPIDANLDAHWYQVK